MYEVEQKYRLQHPDKVARQLEALGAIRGKPIFQADTYFGHPSRDFAKTDEALRIRRIDHCNLVTYKGPKIDQTTKTRREIELPLADGDEGFTQFADLLTAIGFTPVASVRKNRTPWSLNWQGYSISIAMDNVERLGTFIELEIEAEENQLDAARAGLFSLANALGFTKSERRSYMELMAGTPSGGHEAL